jgi:polysaccharide export outer membrane protein
MAIPFRHFGAARTMGCVLALALQVGCSPGTDVPRLPPYTSNGYLLGSGDQLRIITFGEDQLTGEFSVDDQGKIDLPLLGNVQAAGLTPQGLGKQIAQGLNHTGVTRDASVAVQVLAYRPIFVLGEVAKPGQYAYQPGMTMLTAVAVAGGFTYRGVQDDSFLAPGDVIKVYQRRF